MDYDDTSEKNAKLHGGAYDRVLGMLFADANGLGYREQQKGKIEPIFHIIDIDVPVNKKGEILLP